MFRTVGGGVMMEFHFQKQTFYVLWNVYRMNGVGFNQDMTLVKYWGDTSFHVLQPFFMSAKLITARTVSITKRKQYGSPVVGWWFEIASYNTLFSIKFSWQRMGYFCSDKWTQDEVLKAKQRMEDAIVGWHCNLSNRKTCY